MRLLILFFVTILSYAINLPKNFSADFNETITSKNKTLYYKGKIFFKNNSLLWKYTYPTTKFIWIKDKVYIYEPDLEQLTISKKRITLKDIIKHAKHIKDNLYEADINGKKYYFIYDNNLKKVYYTDEFGNKVTINFFNLSNKINNKVFDIKIPKDTDVVYED